MLCAYVYMYIQYVCVFLGGTLLTADLLTADRGTVGEGKKP